MRCRITRPGKLKRFAACVGKPVRMAFYRGNTEGRVDIVCDDGAVYALWPDGSLERDDMRYVDEREWNIYKRKIR